MNTDPQIWSTKEEKAKDEDESKKEEENEKDEDSSSSSFLHYDDYRVKRGKR